MVEKVRYIFKINRAGCENFIIFVKTNYIL